MCIVMVTNSFVQQFPYLNILQFRFIEMTVNIHS